MSRATVATSLRIVVHPATSTRARLLRRAARHVLRAEGFSAGRLEIVLLSDAAMRREHRRWKNRDTSTDTLSFDLRELPDDRRVDGLLMICPATARREARRRGVALEAELALYVVHACLHVVGYDDRRPRDFVRMHRREDELLTELGYGPVFAAGNRRS